MKKSTAHIIGSGFAGLATAASLAQKGVDVTVFESFFSRFGKTASDYYELKKLDPGFTIFFENDLMTIFV